MTSVQLQRRAAPRPANKRKREFNAMRILPRPIGALILIAIAAAAYGGYERLWHRHPSRVAEAPKPAAQPPMPPTPPAAIAARTATEPPQVAPPTRMTSSPIIQTARCRSRRSWSTRRQTRLSNRKRRASSPQSRIAIRSRCRRNIARIMSNGKPRPSTSILKSLLDDPGGEVSLSSARSFMSVFCFVSRRGALSAFAFGLAVIVGAPAMADGDIYVHAGANFKPVTIAVTPFAGEQAGDKISSVIAADFARSIFLLPLNSASFPETIANPDTSPNLDAWKTAAAQFVLTGRVLHQDAGGVTAQFRLWDTATGEQVAGQQYSTETANARRVSHMIADAVFSRVTGEEGFFDSRIVFVDETGPKEKRHKRLAVMDMDGANIKYLDGGKELVVTPRFSPSAQQVAYMSFGSGDPKVTLLNLETGQGGSGANFPGMTFAPRFSPDGQQIALSLSDGASTNLYSIDLRSRATTRLTEGSAIDTSPTYSPDGSQIAFESDRGGSQP